MGKLSRLLGLNKNQPIGRQDSDKNSQSKLKTLFQRNPSLETSVSLGYRVRSFLANLFAPRQHTESASREGNRHIKHARNDHNGTL